MNTIDWSALGAVAGVSFAFGIAVVSLFALGVLGLSRIEAGGRSARSGYWLAGTAFTLCAGAALYGLYLIIPQFH